MTKNVDEYLEKHEDWRDQLTVLRRLLRKIPLEETIKWGGPCYAHNGKNIVGLGAFKNHLALWFYQGALLKDEEQVLINAQVDKTKAMRQWRFSREQKIPRMLEKKYVSETIKNSELGLEIKPDRSKPLELPTELAQYLQENKKLKVAFSQFTLSRQREFADHIASAKRAETRTRRLKTIIPMILDGTGLHDKYR